jgi:hypothetical protein
MTLVDSYIERHRVARGMTPNGPAIKGVFVAERTEAVGSIYRIDFQVL